MATPEALLQSVENLKGVGLSRAQLLGRLGITTIGDILFHFPRHYEEYSGRKKIDQLVEDQVQTVTGEVVEIDGKQTATGKKIISIVLHDGGAVCLEGIWFNQPWVAKNFRYGQQVAFTGMVKWYRDHWQMTMPKVQTIDNLENDGEHTILPVYPLTEDLRIEQLREIMRQAVEDFADHLLDLLPENLRLKRKFPILSQAMRDIHFPATQRVGKIARNRFVYEEFLVLQLALAVRRRDMRYRQRAPILHVTPRIDERIRKLYPFPLTRDQNQVISDIARDLGSDRPMQRLLQADVGAGKTAVAIYAMLAAIANKHQTALMAPTEVLARQHWNTLEQYIGHSRVRRLLLTGSLSMRERREALAEISSGQADIVVGTQALVQEAVQFHKLGLVVIDEQHKFGVNQRARMRKLGIDPHYLVMTATPIPRTVALTVFGDLDISIIRELPPGRQEVRTQWVPETQRARIYKELGEEIRGGRQMMVVCPLVEESETLDLKAAEQTFQELRNGPFKEFQLGLLHGRMEEKSKDQAMTQFRAGQIDILVSTVVIEVGVDVPNATLMIIEHADRFGLSQLHQMRGRITRGVVAGQCYLFAGNVTEDARQRLGIFTRTTDGFLLAEEDAKLRGQGEFFGTRQHGLGELRLGNLITDRDILQQARQDAFYLVKEDPGLKKPEHLLLRKAVLDRYGKTLDLAEIG
ncbi:MAG: ATP-dependent DNA helicase RecG [Bdellovibrionales bacterium]